MNGDLVGEEVTLEGTASEMLSLVVGAAECFMTAAGASGCDSAQLEAGVRQALDDIGDPSGTAIRARLVVVTEGIDVSISADAEGAELHTVSCRV
ncbi:MAG TPA: hypothetical protein QGG47_01125 [Acidobacteriota bacterium]|nr:hypothetical protein [Acidobacteriota bacterium]